MLRVVAGNYYKFKKVSAHNKNEKRSLLVLFIYFFLNEYVYLFTRYISSELKRSNGFNRTYPKLKFLVRAKNLYNTNLTQHHMFI